MSRIKEKDIQYVYDVLLESPEIQNLIRKIANGNMPIHPAPVKNDDCIEEANLRSRLSNVPLQLKETTEELEKYKNFYRQAQPKLERYRSLEDEVADLHRREQNYVSRLEKRVGNRTS